MASKEARKTLTTFALASFLNDLGSDIIFPLWPVFLTSVLGASHAVLGFVDGLGETLVSLSQAVSGYLSDRIRKRKIFVWLGYLCAAVGRVGYAFSTSWLQVIPFRALDRSGKIRGPPRDAMVAELSTKSTRGKNFGFLRTMDNLGAVCGILVTLFFFEKLGYQKLFLLAAVPSVIGSFLVWRLVKERTNHLRLYKGLSFRDISPDFKLFLVASALFALGSFSYSFLLLFAYDAGFPTIFLPVLYLLFTLFAAFFSLPFGILSDRIGRKAVVGVSFALWALVCLGFLFMHGYAAIILFFILYGLHKAALDPVQKTLVAELAPAQFRTSSLGGFQLVIGLCALPSSFIAGMLWDQVGMAAPLYFSLGVTVLSGLVLMMVKE